jgi:predicted dehydrogenase
MIYEPCFVAARRLVQEGRLGPVVQVFGQKSYRFGASRPQDRRWDGGIVQAAIHAFSFIGAVTGERFTEVFAQDTQKGNPGSGDLQMAMTIAARLESGALTTVATNYCNPQGMPYHGNDQLRVHGAHGMLELVDGLNRRRLAIGEDSPTDFEDEAPEKPYPQDLVDGILDGSPTRLTPEASLHHPRLAVAAQASADHGTPVSIEIH